MNGNRKPLILKGWNGGRAGTRTPDLLRVKNTGRLQTVLHLPAHSKDSNQLEQLLCLRDQPQPFQQSGFWHSSGTVAVSNNQTYGAIALVESTAIIDLKDWLQERRTSTFKDWTNRPNWRHASLPRSSNWGARGEEFKSCHVLTALAEVNVDRRRHGHRKGSCVIHN